MTCILIFKNLTEILSKPVDLEFDIDIISRTSMSNCISGVEKEPSGISCWTRGNELSNFDAKNYIGYESHMTP